MNAKQTRDEVVLKEYPNSTRWLEGQRVMGVGNLILTNERLVFIHQIHISEEEIERLRQLSARITTRELIDTTLPFHKKNFQVPLSSVVGVKTGLLTFFPFPRPCLRIFYQSAKKRQVNRLSFIFTIPLWKGWFQLEITTVMGWAASIKRVLRQYKT
jgi:hypothetical protein